MTSKWTIFEHHKVSMMLHGLHYDVVLMKNILQLDVFIHCDIKDEIHHKLLILSRHIFTLNEN